MVVSYPTVTFDNTPSARQEQAFKQLIVDYYPAIDLASLVSHCDPEQQTAAFHALNWVVEMWQEDATYRRAGIELRGASKIADFYQLPFPQGRSGLVGSHDVSKILPVPDLRPGYLSIVAEGIFTHHSGWQIGFLDLWQIRISDIGKGKISYRETFLISEELNVALSASDPKIISSAQTKESATFIIGDASIGAQNYRFATIVEFKGLQLVGLKYWNQGAERLKP